jgi:colicin import membrane protein
MAQALTLPHDPPRDYLPGLLVSTGLHLALLAVLALNFNFMPRPDPQPVRLAIQATVVDAGALRRQAEAAERRERERQLEAKRQVEARQAAEQQRVAEADARREAQARRKAEAEAQRKADAAAKRKLEVDAQRKAAAGARRKAEAEAQRKVQAEAKRTADAEAQRKAEAERRLAQSRAELARAMAEEEQLDVARASGLLDQYAEVIRQKVERNWIRPASAREGLSCVVLVRQIPGGEVVDVRIVECNGDAAVLRSIETAVLRSSPLPAPPDPALFERTLEFTFRPRD